MIDRTAILSAAVDWRLKRNTTSRMTFLRPGRFIDIYIQAEEVTEVMTENDESFPVTNEAIIAYLETE